MIGKVRVYIYMNPPFCRGVAYFLSFQLTSSAAPGTQFGKEKPQYDELA